MKKYYFLALLVFLLPSGAAHASVVTNFGSHLNATYVSGGTGIADYTNDLICDSGNPGVYNYYTPETGSGCTDSADGSQVFAVYTSLSTCNGGGGSISGCSDFVLDSCWKDVGGSWVSDTTDPPCASSPPAPTATTTPTNGLGVAWLLNLLAWLQSLAILMFVLGAVYVFVLMFRMIFPV